MSARNYNRPTFRNGRFFMCGAIINKYQIYWYNFDTVSFFVTEDINTPICGKEEDGCAKLARSECNNINHQPLFCTFALHISNSGNRI
jgi:hypothetical protein